MARPKTNADLLREFCTIPRKAAANYCGNMTYSGMTLWSYRTPIAQLHAAPDVLQQPTYYLAISEYHHYHGSVTTKRHIHDLIRTYVSPFLGNDVGAQGRYGCPTPSDPRGVLFLTAIDEPEADVNVTAYHRRIDSCITSLISPRTGVTTKIAALDRANEALNALCFLYDALRWQTTTHSDVDYATAYYLRLFREASLFPASVAALTPRRPSTMKEDVGERVLKAMAVLALEAD